MTYSKYHNNSLYMLKKISITDPINPKLKNWIDHVPESIRNNEPLMDCLLRFVDRLWSNLNTTENTNPFYKILEKLREDKLYYNSLETIDEYYSLGIIDYLIDGNRGEYYIGKPCNTRTQLKKALSVRNNKTDGNTLNIILSAMV